MANTSKLTVEEINDTKRVFDEIVVEVDKGTIKLNEREDEFIDSMKEKIEMYGASKKQAEWIYDIHMKYL